MENTRSTFRGMNDPVIRIFKVKKSFTTASAFHHASSSVEKCPRVFSVSSPIGRLKYFVYSLHPSADSNAQPAFNGKRFQNIFWHFLASLWWGNFWTKPRTQPQF